MFTEEYSKFETFYNRFIANKDYDMHLDESWFDNVQAAHKTIRQKIGGIRLEKDIFLDVVQNLIPWSQACSYYNLLESAIGYKYTCLNSLGVFISHINLPTMTDEHGRLIRTNKFIQNKLISKLKESDATEEDKNRIIANVRDVLSKLGQEWSRYRSDKVKYHVNLTTAAKAFTLLGHYGPDCESCYAIGSSRECDKYTLGQSDNTFVIIVRSDDKNIARMWGFASKDMKTFNVCNLYMANEIRDGNIKISLEKFFSKYVFDDKKCYVYDRNIYIPYDSSVIYHNMGDYDWSFSSKKSIDGTDSCLDINYRNIDHITECDMCGTPCYSSAEEIVDGTYVCRVCAESSHLCSSCGECLTFNDSGLCSGCTELYEYDRTLDNVNVF